MSIIVPSARLTLLHDLLFASSETASSVLSIDSRATGIVPCTVDSRKYDPSSTDQWYIVGIYIYL